MSRRTRETIVACLRHPLFLGVLALKIAASCLVGGVLFRHYFVPFVNWFVQSGFANPWERFLQLGLPKAFPYAPLMLDVLALPRVLLAPLLASPDPFTVTWLHNLALRLPLLLADVVVYLVLALWIGAGSRRALWLYWCSPIVFFINYYHGQLDVIPTALLVLSLFWTFRRRYLVSAVWLGLGLATKAHLWIAIPFILIYWFRHGVRWRQLLGYAAAITSIYGVFVAPYLASSAYRQMVLGAEEQRWIFALAFPKYHDTLAFLACPAALFLLLMKFASYPKVNREILLFFLGTWVLIGFQGPPS